MTERFSTAAPISLYGATKLASEIMALQYGATFVFPVWVDRCGVIKIGPSQFGKIDQGIFSFWIYQAGCAAAAVTHLATAGAGSRCAICSLSAIWPTLLDRQLRASDPEGTARGQRGGGNARAMEPARAVRLVPAGAGDRAPDRQRPRDAPFDIPYYVTDNALAEETWGWQPAEPRDETLERILRWARQNLAALEIYASLTARDISVSPRRAMIGQKRVQVAPGVVIALQW